MARTGAWRRARRSRCWSTSTTRSPAARSASTSPCRSASRPSTRRSAAGIRAGELLLIGGAQGTGKTTMALQMARNVASGGQANVLYICFEHDELYLLNRLIAAESALAHLPAQDRRDQDPGRPQGDPRARGWPRAAAPPSWPPTRGSARRSTGSPATARTCSCSAARRPRARSTACAQLIRQHKRAVGRPPAAGRRRLPPEGAGDPRAAERDREGHLRRSTASRTSRCPRTCR